MAMVCTSPAKISARAPSFITIPAKTHSISQNPHQNSLPAKPQKEFHNPSQQFSHQDAINREIIPTMSEILDYSSNHQNLHLQLQKFGPFFRIKATSLKTNRELGRAEGFIRAWVEAKILHLDSIRLSRETLSMEKSIFGLGLFVGAVAVRHGFDCGCRKAELLAINDTDIYHSKLVRFYTRIGFKAVHEVTGSSVGDLAHMLVWGGKGTRMDADIEELLIKWGSKFKPRN